MAATQQQLSPAPFDAVASRYDATFTFSSIGRAQRNAVWLQLGNAFRPGERVLDIGCGTGIDACFLATGGVRVVACDSSSQMIAVADRRIREDRLQKLVQPIHLPAEEIPSLHTSALFDGAYSNFGALNCVEDIRKFAADLARLLKPGASAWLCWIGPFCLWETVWYLSQRQIKKAFRRLNRSAIETTVGAGPSFQLRYPTVRYLSTSFAPSLRLRSIRGIGITVPPSYVESWATKHPRLLKWCEKADTLVGRIPGARVLADHILLEFERVDSTSV
jgi:ubiquinone/menaquinone biosynthesis C-methylase UbiE